MLNVVSIILTSVFEYLTKEMPKTAVERFLSSFKHVPDYFKIYS